MKLDTRTAEEKKNEEMEIEGFKDLPTLFDSPIEKFMDQFNGNTKELKGLFKVSIENNIVGNIQQQICNTSKNRFELTNGECNLFGLPFTETSKS